MKISACMIVRNEEKFIYDCLLSIYKYVDEIIIIDTGSTDQTTKIIAEFQHKNKGLHLYRKKWNDSFSDMRNFSISKATHEWIFIIDSDERLNQKDGQQLRLLVNSTSPVAKNPVDIDIFYMHQISQKPSNNWKPSFTKVSQPRLFRNVKSIFYHGRVHNALTLTEKLALTPVQIFHLGYDLPEAEQRKKSVRTLILLQKEYHEKIDLPFTCMNLSQVNIALKEFEEAKRYALEAIKLSEGKKEKIHILLMSYNQLATIHTLRSEFETAITYCNKAIKLDKMYIDVILKKGYCEFSLKKYVSARKTMIEFKKKREMHLKNPFLHLYILESFGSDHEADRIIEEIDRKEKETGEKIEFNPSLFKGLIGLNKDLINLLIYMKENKKYMNLSDLTLLEELSNNSLNLIPFHSEYPHMDKKIWSPLYD